MTGHSAPSVSFLNPFGVTFTDLMQFFKHNHEPHEGKELEKVWCNKRFHFKGIDRSLPQVLALDVRFLPKKELTYLIEDLSMILGGTVKAQLIGYTPHVGSRYERRFLIARCVSVKPHDEVCAAFAQYIQKRMDDFTDSEGTRRLVVLPEKIRVPWDLLG